MLVFSWDGSYVHEWLCHMSEDSSLGFEEGKYISMLHLNKQFWLGKRRINSETLTFRQGDYQDLTKYYFTITHILNFSIANIDN